MKTARRRYLTPQETEVLQPAIRAYFALSSTRERLAMLDALSEKLNHANSEGAWERKRVRQWLWNHRDAHQQNATFANNRQNSMSSLPLTGAGGTKRQQEPTSAFAADLRHVKRANSFSDVDEVASETWVAKETKRLETLLHLELARMPKNPNAIFQMTKGEELAAQLSFNWRLEERLAMCCALLLRSTGSLAAPTLDGATVVKSAIDPCVAQECIGDTPPQPMDLTGDGVELGVAEIRGFNKGIAHFVNNNNNTTNNYVNNNNNNNNNNMHTNNNFHVKNVMFVHQDVDCDDLFVSHQQRGGGGGSSHRHQQHLSIGSEQLAGSTSSSFMSEGFLEYAEILNGDVDLPWPEGEWGVAAQGAAVGGTASSISSGAMESSIMDDCRGDFVRFEPHVANARGHELLEADALEAEQSLKNVADLGAALSVRDGNVAVHTVSLAGTPCAASMENGGRVYVTASVLPGEVSRVSLAGLERDVFRAKDFTIGSPDDGVVQRVALDAYRSTLWASFSGRSILGFDVNDLSKGPLHRLTVASTSAGANTGFGPYFGRPSPLLLNRSTLYLATGNVINMWDLEDLDVTSSSDISSQGNESLSLSDGDASPPRERKLSPLSRRFCKCCHSICMDKRRCTECNTEVCNKCSCVYKLTSLGESKPRSICNICIPAIRKRIMSQQQASRLPNLVDRTVAAASPTGSAQLNGNANRRTISPHARQEVGGEGRSEFRIGFLEPDAGAADAVVMAFEERPCALTWSLSQATEQRWFVGHTGSITALHTNESIPNTVFTASKDRSVKIWDSRARPASLTFLGHVDAVNAIASVSFGSGTYCMTGGTDECIKVWDLRRASPLYELSTGNNEVQSLHWSPRLCSLIATTTSKHASDSASAWPANALRGATHFRKVWNSGTNCVIQYDFFCSF